MVNIINEVTTAVTLVENINSWNAVPTERLNCLMMGDLAQCCQEDGFAYWKLTNLFLRGVGVFILLNSPSFLLRRDSHFILFYLKPALNDKKYLYL